MNDEIIRKHLEELHLEIINLPPAEDAIQQKRDAFTAYLRDLISQKDLQKEHLLLKDRFDASVESFEVTHPVITQLISRITEMLNSIGV